MTPDDKPGRLPISRKHIRGVVQVAISIAFLTIVLRQIGWHELKDALSRMDLAWLGVAFALFLLGVVVRAARWQVLLNDLGVHRPLNELTMWYFVGGFFNVILPTGFGGDAVRVVELSQDTHQPGPVLNSVLVDRYMGLMVLLAMGLTAGLLQPAVAPPQVLIVIGTLFFGGLVAAWALTRPWWQRWQEREDLFGRVVQKSGLPTISSALTHYTPAGIAKVLLISLVFNLLLIGWNMAIAQGLDLHLSLTAYLVFVPLTSVALLLPAFGGLGVRELTYVALLSSIGVPKSSALALSLGVYVITVGTGLIGGILYLTQGLRRVRGTT
ncbi:MAG: lysylphosphatidylglycerol synthase transmembrane domain-containing protein [Chloroflexota bacterium]|nr:lysylphosphatidylglycerol synthase transmembrane domain-containing protein [Chloroflexota bacterium]